MNVVTLVSGGMDSTVMAQLLKREGFSQQLLFIRYGQLNFEREFEACARNMRALGIGDPTVVDLHGYGVAFPSGLTDSALRIKEDAFLPGRNMLFLICAAARAVQTNCEALAIGFLDESLSLFPDQTRAFANQAEAMLTYMMGRKLSVLTPLINMRKAEVVEIARSFGVSGTYSCHAGADTACGRCIACLEYSGLEV